MGIADDRSLPSQQPAFHSKLLQSSEHGPRILNGTPFRRDDATIQIEGKTTLPDSLNRKCFRQQSHVCKRRGKARRATDIVVEDKTNTQAAWTYADPKTEVSEIKALRRVLKGVQVEG
jgi:hypothetical protein